MSNTFHRCEAHLLLYVKIAIHLTVTDIYHRYLIHSCYYT